jgi:hypothetical protein
VAGRLIAAVLTALALGAAALPAAALQFTQQRLGGVSVVLASGEIVAGDADRLAAFLTGRPVSGATVVLDSPGGDLVEGMVLGALIRQQRLGTRILSGDECASACVFSFVGGVVREVDNGARLGVHTASLMFSDAYVSELTRVLAEPGLSLTDRVRLVVLLNEQHTSMTMALQANFLARMGVSLKLLFPSSETHHLDMYWLSRRELLEFNVVNTD